MAESFSKAFTQWVASQNDVPRDLVVSHTEELEWLALRPTLSPLETLFLGLVEWKHEKFDNAALLVFQACCTLNGRVLGSSAVFTIRHICHPEICFFELDENGEQSDTDINETSGEFHAVTRLAQYMKQYNVFRA
jgi:hypothetical protein